MAHGGTTDAGANVVPTPPSFEGLETREEVIAKPLTSLFWQPRADRCQGGCERHCHGYQPCRGDFYFLNEHSRNKS